MSNWDEPPSAYDRTSSTTQVTVGGRAKWAQVVAIFGVGTLAVCAFVLPATIIIATANRETTTVGGSLNNITGATVSTTSTSVTTGTTSSTSTTTTTSISTSTTTSTTSSSSTTTSTTSSTSTTTSTTSSTSTTTSTTSSTSTTTSTTSSTSTTTSTTSTSSTTTTTTTQCSPMFPSQTTYSTGSITNPFGTTVADFNSDNKSDIMVAYYSGNSVGVLLNSGTGTFPTISTYLTGSGSGPYSTAAVDVNSDNKPDIIVGNAAGYSVGVLLNSGTGTFPTITTYSIGSTLYSVAVGDVNSDGKPDITVPNYSSNSVDVLLNSGTGTFPTITSYSIGSNTNPYCVATVDVNGDSKLDIIVGTYSGYSVCVLLNSGTGTFPTITTYSVSSSVLFMAVVDVNSDSKPDIILTKNGANNLAVLLNSGTGTFPTISTYSTGTSFGPYNVAVVDVNSDSKPDIIVPNYSTNNVGVLLNSGTGTFPTQTTYSTGSSSYPSGVAVIDLNNDNKYDIIVTNYGTGNVGVLLHC